MVGKLKYFNAAKSSGAAAYVEFVNTLFADPKSLCVGIALQVGLMLVFIVETQKPLFLFFIVAAIIGSVWRLNIARKYNEALEAHSNLDLAQQASLANVWERKYVIPSTFTAANIGFFSLFGLVHANSAFATSAVIILLFSPVPTIVGRVYGSRRLATFLLLGQFSPVIFGYFAMGDMAHIMLALFCLPYIALILGMVDNVRATVVRAVDGNAEIVELGHQFDVALNNMSHGLMMFDDQNRISIMNNEAGKLLNVASHLRVAGRSLDALLRYSRRFSDMSAENLNQIENSMRALLMRADDRRQIPMDDGRFIELTVSERTTGGAVMTLEDVTERVLSATKIERMAQFDALTGLANRQHFEGQVSDYLAAADQGYCALIVADIDDFKYVNDTVGHGQGDELLRGVARILEDVECEEQLACRLGGDEFLLFVGGLKSECQATSMVSKLSANLTGVYDLRHEEIYVSCSLGFVTSPMSTFRLDQAILSADLALYDAKAGKKGAWSKFDQSMDDQYHRRQKIKKRLANAIDSGELDLIYQPLVDAETGRLVSCEALSRWFDPEFGHVSPAEYIPLAEEMGVIAKITSYMLHRAVQECVDWPEHVTVSVNLSQIDFRTGDISSVIDSALQEAGLPPERLEIEVTETAVTSNEYEMIEKLRAIHGKGVRIALDDFGTGQSSLSYLHRLPLDKVKIDQSFVVGIDTGETPLCLLRGVTELCKTLGLDITVEGVETESQLRLILEHAQVDRIQGYIYGAALPASGIDTLSRLTSIPLKEASAKLRA